MSRRPGRSRVLDLATGSVLGTPFLTVSVNTENERGLLGLAFDPDYREQWLFLHLSHGTTPTTNNVVERYQVSSNPNVANAASRQTVINLDNATSAANHNGGWIGFGPDNDLYIATGDNANGANAQTLSNLLGKILRIDVEGGLPYEIPSDNPFVGTPGARPEILALGLRNPWRASFDSASGTLFLTDVGEQAIEEVNLGQKGANYGWPISEGPSANPAFVNPIAFYDHSVGNAITGGYVYNGESDGLNGQYFYTDFGTHRLFTLRFDGTNWISTERTSQVQTNVGTINNPSSFGEDARGNLYVVDIDGEVYRLNANCHLVGPRRCADRQRGQRPAVRRRGARQSRWRDRGGFPQRRGRRRPLHLRAGLWRGHDFRLRCGRGERGQDQPRAFANVSTFADVLARATQVGSDTVINFGGGDTLTLRNVARSSLAADDFIFVG